MPAADCTAGGTPAARADAAATLPASAPLGLYSSGHYFGKPGLGTSTGTSGARPVEALGPTWRRAEGGRAVGALQGALAAC